ncbi:hypothetical protein BJX62DRAFT_93431 [Aspergillus germanicus]
MSSLFLHSLSVVSPLSFLRSSSFLFDLVGIWSLVFFFVFLFIILDYISQYYIHPGPYCDSPFFFSFFFRFFALFLCCLWPFSISAFSIQHPPSALLPSASCLVADRVSRTPASLSPTRAVALWLLNPFPLPCIAAAPHHSK